MHVLTGQYISGVIIHFKHLKNFDTQILNPLWLTNGVYRIVNSSRVAENNGLLDENELDAVINHLDYQKNETDDKFSYPKHKLNYIIRVMQEFELCFQLETGKYIIPQLLPVDEPMFEFGGATIQVVIEFPDFLPESIFPRLMVNLHHYIKDDLCWRSGMVLSKPNVFDATARIRSDREDKLIKLDVCGNEPRRFLSFIRETLKEVIHGFKNLNFKEMVKIPGTDVKRDYSELVSYEQMGVTEFPVGELKRQVSVSDLLDGVEEASMRNLYKQQSIRAFISYSHIDKEGLGEFKAALAPLVRLDQLQIWDDYAIDAGSDWEEEILKQLEHADIVLCLISADFIKSDFCFKRELETALEAHRKNKKLIVPIQYRDCDWKDLSIASIQALPGQWIKSDKDRDARWSEVSKGLRPLIKKLKRRIEEKDLISSDQLDEIDSIGNRSKKPSIR